MGQTLAVKIVHASTEKVAGKEVTVYELSVSLPRGQSWRVQHRYSEFLELQEHFQTLRVDVPAVATLPSFPPKKMFGAKDPVFVEQRRAELETWVSAATQLPEVAHDGVLLNFLEASQRLLSGDTTPDPGSTVPSGDAVAVEGRQFQARDWAPGSALMGTADREQMMSVKFREVLIERANATFLDPYAMPGLLEGQEAEERTEKIAKLIETLSLSNGAEAAARPLPAAAVAVSGDAAAALEAIFALLGAKGPSRAGVAAVRAHAAAVQLALEEGEMISAPPFVVRREELNALAGGAGAGRPGSIRQRVPLGGALGRSR